MVERVAENDDQLMVSFLEGREIGIVELEKAIRRATISNAISPVLTGSALRNKGVQTLLDAVVAYLPSPLDVPPITAHSSTDPEATVERRAADDEPLAALAFKVVSDPFVGRLVFFRVYSGVVRSGDQVLNSMRNRRERFGRLLRMHADSREDVEEVFAGEIAAGIGLAGGLSIVRFRTTMPRVGPWPQRSHVGAKRYVGWKNASTSSRRVYTRHEPSAAPLG